MTAVHAGTPAWTSTPLTPTTITITKNSTALIKYTVTNQSTIVHQLTMTPIKGITQINTGVGVCKDVFSLPTKGSSCILVLRVNGKEITKKIVGGPSVCQQGLGKDCYTPASSAILNITPIEIKRYTVGGNISGLVGTVVLKNGTASQSIKANGNFTFATPLPTGSAYAVTVQTQPLNQTCTVSNGKGTIGNVDVKTIKVSCTTHKYTVGGNVSGLIGTLSLSNNGSNVQAISADGHFTFSTQLTNGSAYAVSIHTQPNHQTCTVSNGTGTIKGANVANVAVTCTTDTYQVGGIVSGLVGTVVLQNNDADEQTISTDGKFTFSTQLTSGSAYLVTIKNQPQDQTCIVNQGTGTIDGASVDTISVTCTTNTYTVGGTMSGLTGTMVLSNRGSDPQIISADGNFTFSTRLTNGSNYVVSIQTHPDNQTCTVSNASGTIKAANVANVSVTCTTDTYLVGGTVSGLVGTVVLQNNGVDKQTIDSNGEFTFPTQLTTGSAYLVTITKQPQDQTCIVNQGAGTINRANVSTISVACTTNTYTVSGTISGLIGKVVLSNRGTDPQIISSDGNFTFSTPLTNGSIYAVSVQIQPVNQTCTVNNAAGKINGENISNIIVTCSTNNYTIGGSISGLTGQLKLQNNDSELLSVTSNGNFKFTKPISQGSSYAVTIKTQPANQTCSVSNGSGPVGSMDITTVLVTCATNAYTVGGSVTNLSGKLLLQNNNTDALPISENVEFTFKTPIAQGSQYEVTVKTQPLTQTCEVFNGKGTMGSNDIFNVSVECADNTTTISVDPTGMIPVNPDKTGTLVVTNTGKNTALNVSATLPGGWIEVAQYSSDCDSLDPGASCKLSFSAKAAYVAQKDIVVKGTNTMPQTTALAFTIQDYLVFSVDSPNSATVMDSHDLSDATWGSGGITVGTNYTDGSANTAAIVINNGAAASACAKVGWYLPAICQMVKLKDNESCAHGIGNIDSNLFQLGFKNDMHDSAYWSSSEVIDYKKIDPNYAMSYDFNFPLQSRSNKIYPAHVRCVRSLPF